jgi:hypothetical protein
MMVVMMMMMMMSMRTCVPMLVTFFYATREGHIYRQPNQQENNNFQLHFCFFFLLPTTFYPERLRQV